MYLQAVKTIISETNLAVTPTMAQQTANLLQSMFGENIPYQWDLEILAALAIKGELNLSNRHIDSGTSIEAVMRHIGGHSKEDFLTVVARQSVMIIEDQTSLKNKITKLKRCHQIYQKYKTVFDKLSSRLNGCSKQVQFNLMGVFWILYLLIKHKIQTQNGMIKQVSILRTIFFLLFKDILDIINQQQIYCVFAQSFLEIDQVNEQKQKELRLEMLNKLNQVHRWRHHEDPCDLQKLLSNDNYILRYLDDISNHYGKLKSSEIDQLSFLELQKTLTPLPPTKNIKTVLFDRKINFDDDDEISLPSVTPTPKSNRFQQKDPFVDQMNRKQNLAWINKIITNVNTFQIESVRLIYQTVSAELSILDKIRQSIQSFTPTCLDKQKREQSLYKFFIHLVHKITEEHTETQNVDIFNNESSINSLLCLSVHIFNYAYHCTQNSYESYCQLFKIKLLQGHRPINWLGLNLNLPKNIGCFLYNLQKRILLTELWKDSISYLSITQIQNQSGYHNYVVLRRLKMHVQQQVKVLCSQVQIMELVRYIVEKRLNLFISNTIDTVLVCCICAIFGEITLQDYEDSFNPNSVYNEESSSANLSDYYHTVFLPSIEEIIQEKDNQLNIRTPQKINRKIRYAHSLKRTPLTYAHVQRQIGRQSGNKQSSTRGVRTFLFGSLDDL